MTPGTLSNKSPTQFRDSSLSHSTNTLIFAWSSQNSKLKAYRLVVPYVATYCTSSTNVLVVGPSTVRPMVLWVCCMPLSLLSTDRVSWLASFVQGWVRAVRIASLRRSSSISFCSNFPAFNRVNCFTVASVRSIDQISSNYLCFSMMSAPIFCRVGSSYNEVHNSMVYSNNSVQPLTASSKVAIPYLITTLHYSWTSRGVVGCSFNS